MTIVMLVMAAAWWITLAWDAMQGRTPWTFPLLCVVVLLAWAVMARRWAKSLKPQPALRLHWLPPGMPDVQDAPRLPTRWCDDRGRPLDVRIAMDFGAGMLLSVRAMGPVPSGPPTPLVQWRWVGAQTLQGPWRWRLMTGDRQSLLPADEKPMQPMVASWALSASHKAPLPKSARRSA